MRGFFKSQFANASDTSALDTMALDVQIESLMEPFTNLDCDGIPILTIHHGLIDSNGYKLTAVLSYDCATWDLTNEPKLIISIFSNDYYSINADGTLQDFSSGLANWKRTHFQQNYQRGVIVKRNENDSDWDSTNSSSKYDVHQISYKKVNIEDLINSNSGAEKIRIVPVAEPEEWTDNDVNQPGLEFRQKFALVCLNPNGEEIIEDGEYQNGYFQRGLDIGSPCPEDCPDVNNGLKFPAIGTKHRGCEYFGPSISASAQTIP